MNFYKKIFRSKKLRFKILHSLKFIPDELMIKIQYFIKCGRRLDLKNPERYSEKIQWYKLYYRNMAMQQCADKYRVREYIEKKGLGHILNELYAVYKRPADISIEDLPNQFVLKSNNGSGTNIICKDKKEHSLEEIKKEFEGFFFQSSVSAGREWVYSDIEPVIIAERYLEDESRVNRDICDYKFLCFNGKPHYIAYDTDRFAGHKRNIYDTQWNNLEIETDCKCSTEKVPRPENLDEMLDIAAVLAEDFPAVRVDLYSIGGKIYFGEMTFFPWSGYVKFAPDEFDLKMGEKFILPERNN